MDLSRTPLAEDWRQAGLARRWDAQGKTGLRLMPQEAPQVADMLGRIAASGLQVAMNPHEAALLELPIWLDLSRLTAVRQASPDDFIIQVEAGMSFGALNRILAENTQVFPLSYPADMALGDVLAEDEAALESGLRGYPRDYVLKTEVAGPDGHLTISGADVVKNVTGYDLAKLYVGGWHAFGVITSVTLRLSPLPERRIFALYPPDSADGVFALAERLLANNPPISICEAFREGTDWRLLLVVEGDAELIVSCLDSLGRLGLGAPDLLSEADGAALITRLASRPTDLTLIESAFLPSGWQEPAVSLVKQSALSAMRFQIRPAAGLIRIGAPSFPLSAFPYIQEETAQHGGFCRILQISPTDAALAAQTPKLLESFNLPEDPGIRHLLDRLKTVYDPGGILFTPRLPLQPMTPSPS